MSYSRVFYSLDYVTIAGEGQQNLGRCSMLIAFIYRATLAVTRGLNFCYLIQKTVPHSRFLHQARGVIVCSFVCSRLSNFTAILPLYFITIGKHAKGIII
jgi:hypothetical protein